MAWIWMPKIKNVKRAIEVLSMVDTTCNLIFAEDGSSLIIASVHADDNVTVLAYFDYDDLLVFDGSEPGGIRVQINDLQEFLNKCEDDAAFELNLVPDSFLCLTSRNYSDQHASSTKQQEIFRGEPQDLHLPLIPCEIQTSPRLFLPAEPFRRMVPYSIESKQPITIIAWGCLMLICCGDKKIITVFDKDQSFGLGNGNYLSARLWFNLLPYFVEVLNYCSTICIANLQPVAYLYVPSNVQFLFYSSHKESDAALMTCESPMDIASP